MQAPPINEVMRAKQKPPPVTAGDGNREGGDEMYTEFGFVKDGIEYATIDEALESSDDS